MTTSQWTAIPRAIVPDRVAALRVKVVLAAVLFAAFAGPCSFVMTLAKSAQSPAATPTYRYAGFAQLAAMDYLAGRDTTLPRVQELPPDLGREAAPSTDGSGRQTSVKPIPAIGLALDRSRSEVLGDKTEEIHTFVFSTTGGKLYNLAVTVLITDNGPVIAALPALSPGRVAPVVPGVDYKTLGNPANVDEGVTTQVRAWASAYARDDEEGLYRVTGDTQERRYVGLGGYVVTTQPSVLSSIAKGDKQLVQIRVTMTNLADPGVVLTSDFDLLLEGRGKKALPDVAAWGPAGTGMSLERYQNAVYTPAPLADVNTTTTIELYVPPAAQPDGADEAPPADNTNGVDQ
ncbi:MAG TPA: hypothetical protein VHD87_12670 [Acidimicrobiales bacterium]|nr:hypothetical protein [Acidimicrobiales bacterium]